jgi:hypothetical protein
MFAYLQQSEIDFVKVAPFLTHPLVLCGFTIMLFYGVLKTLIRARILKPIGEASGAVILRLLLNYGFIVAILIVLLGFGLEGYRTWLKSSGTYPNVRREIGRDLTPIQDVSVSVEMDVALGDPSLKPYLSRLEKGIRDAKGRYIAAHLPLDAAEALKRMRLTKDLKIYYKENDPNSDFLLPASFDIDWDSPLLPNKTAGEALAKALLSGQNVSLTFYKKAIDPRNYIPIPVSASPQADWSFLVCPTGGRKNKDSFAYFTYPAAQETIRLTARNVPVGTYTSHTAKIVSLADLSGSQVFVSVNEILDASFADNMEHIQQQVRLVKLSLEVGPSKIVIPIDLSRAMRVRDFPHSVLVCTMPANVN